MILLYNIKVICFTRRMNNVIQRNDKRGTSKAQRGAFKRV